MLLVGVFVSAVTLFGQDPDQRVQAKEPTVVTVQGVAERVEPTQTAARPRRKASRFRLGGLKALAGAGSIAGWMLNVDDDIPASREDERHYRNQRSR